MRDRPGTPPVLSVDRPVLPATGASTVTVTGGNYLVPKTAWNAATNRCNDVRGGVYVFFGWVNPAGNWGPSTRANAPGAGKFGSGYTYPGESGGAETREVAADVPIRFVSFSPGGESGSSTPFHMDGAGNWSTQLVVTGPTYAWSGEGLGSAWSTAGAVQCGVFTIGAHGIPSATNEVFTPITFTVPAGATAGGGGGERGIACVGWDRWFGRNRRHHWRGGVTGGGGTSSDPATSGSPDAASGGETATTLAADAFGRCDPLDDGSGTEPVRSRPPSRPTRRRSRTSGDDGGSASAPLLGALFGVLLAGGVVAVVMVRRRNRGAGGRGEPSAPAAG